MTHPYLITGCRQIPEDQAMLRVGRLDKGLEVPGMLHPVGEGTSDQNHMIVWFGFQGCGSGAGHAQHHGQRNPGDAQESFHHKTEDESLPTRLR